MFPLRPALAVCLSALLTLTLLTGPAARANDSTPAAKQTKPAPARTAKKRTAAAGATAKVTKLQPVQVAPARDVMNDHRPLTLAGWVTGADGLPLPGATVWMTNTHAPAVVTNGQGDFLLALPSNAPVSLTIGCAGYHDQVVMLNQPHLQNGVSVALQPLARR
ncbi:carboxypeptidase-like regulatory domain-containing protein [Hymenobacter chitinivorans]|uniref:Carboxypeptidase family protein n=1 Tax=Hymenobacter chitinivorans DSM 11115 TaxID=1121954 RepID=A0A2M9BPN0_9BACT|nr:carboxypeptidase-like regulatory domain-containing protein [Hymenobacter chitinivorans]PJJ59914.1 carboxypeptidase family protein [Hymenobacter chitinivorans DSM 11115]